MKDAQPGAIRLADYRPPDFLVDQVDLVFSLHEDHAIVDSALKLRRNPAASGDAELELDGQELELLELALDGQVLAADSYQLDGDSLRLPGMPAAFTLTCRTRIRPQDNTSLEGLYKSRTMFCTQCEAEGFRKITYFPDRPDVMSVYTVTIEADKPRYPVLLSNGNLESVEDIDGGRHRARWSDPWPKPSYLFALVAGDLGLVEDRFETRSGRCLLYTSPSPRDA